MPKRPCTNRAKWRLLRGKPAQPLSAHYRLDCDFGTPVLSIYREGEGDTPTYLCELHTAAERDAAAARPERRSVGDDGPVASVDCEVDYKFDRESDRKVDREVIRSADPGPADNLPPKHDDQIASVGAAAPKPSVAAIEASASSKPIPSVQKPIVASDSNAPAPNPDVLASQPCAPEPKPKATAPPAPKPTLPLASEAPTARAERVPPVKVSSFSRGPIRDLTYGNPAKALVDETIWNLQPGDYDAYRTALRQGKSAMEAAQSAGGQLAVVHRKIQEYTARIYVLLSASNVTVNVEVAVHAVLESETLKIIADDVMADEQKDAAVAHLGAFQERINHGLSRPATALQAHGVALAIATGANWGAVCPSIPREHRAVYRAVYTSLRDAIRAAVPDVRDADERLANLYAAKSDLDALLYTEIATPDHLRVAASDLSSTHEQKFAEI